MVSENRTKTVCIPVNGVHIFPSADRGTCQGGIFSFLALSKRFTCRRSRHVPDMGGFITKDGVNMENLDNNYWYVRYWYEDANQCVLELEDRRMEIICQMQKVYEQHGMCRQFKELSNELNGTEGIYRAFRRSRENFADQLERLTERMNLDDPR